MFYTQKNCFIFLQQLMNAKSYGLPNSKGRLTVAICCLDRLISISIIKGSQRKEGGNKPTQAAHSSILTLDMETNISLKRSPVFSSNPERYLQTSGQTAPHSSVILANVSGSMAAAATEGFNLLSARPKILQKHPEDGV